MVDEAALQRELQTVGTALAEALPSSARHPVKALDDKAMDLASADRELKAALFRFVDVVPACRSLDDLARHLTGFLGELETPPPPVSAAMRMGNTRAGRTALGKAAAAGVRHMAHRFIIGEDPRAALGVLRELWKDGVASSVDLLGEATVTQPEAERYAARCSDALETMVAASRSWPARHQLDRDAAGPLPRANLSVKVSALTPLLRPDAPEPGKRDALPRLRSLLRQARDLGAHLHIDMESLDSRDAVLELVLGLLAEDEFRTGPSSGVVLQAYLRDSPETLEEILAWVTGPGERRDLPLTVRLVKGAYWDHEIVEAAQHGWTAPVFEVKADCDRNYEVLTRRLLDARIAGHGVRAAIASHNLRSVAHAIAYNRLAGGSDRGIELQVLRGLGDPLQAAIAAQGLHVRSYCPVGDLVAGMAYLVRRLLENTSNDSFLVEQARGVPIAELLAPPGEGEALRETPAPGRPMSGEALRGVAGFANEPVLELRRAPVRAGLADALAALDAELPLPVPVWVGEDRRAREDFASTDPGRPDRIVAHAAEATPAEVDAALDAAQRGAREWGSVPAERRAEVLLDAAAWMRERRLRLAALAVRECAKPWPEADADVCEAIDFLEYYARGAVELERSAELLQVPGERNDLRWAPRGVAAVISPWNFPVAICCGMTSAALATGNAAVVKPAEQSPACGLMVVEALRAAGRPRRRGRAAARRGRRRGGARGRPAGAHDRLHRLGRGRPRDPAHRGRGPEGQKHLKRVIAEMGGKNVVIVDSDADLDDVVPALITSAYGFAGQKCSAASRVLCHEAIHDALLERLAGRVEVLRVGDAADLEIDVPAVIEREARDRVERYVAEARDAGRGSPPRRTTSPGTAGSRRPPWRPTCRADSPVLPGGDLRPRARDRAGRATSPRPATASTRRAYALTGGLFARNPDTVDYVVARSPVGNLYVNRNITGAMVGRQPFGGNRLSGTGDQGRRARLPAAVHRAARRHREHDAPRAGRLAAPTRASPSGAGRCGNPQRRRRKVGRGADDAGRANCDAPDSLRHAIRGGRASLEIGIAAGARLRRRHAAGVSVQAPRRHARAAGRARAARCAALGRCSPRAGSRSAWRWRRAPGSCTSPRWRSPRSRPSRSCSRPAW